MLRCGGVADRMPVAPGWVQCMPEGFEGLTNDGLRPAAGFDVARAGEHALAVVVGVVHRDGVGAGTGQGLVLGRWP